MKPEDLPLYKAPLEVQLVDKTQEKLPLEPQVARAREYVTERSQPVIGAWTRSCAFVSDGINNVSAKYNSINDVKLFYQKAAIIGGSIMGGWIIGSFLRKSGRLQRVLTPILFGTLSAAVCYPDKSVKLFNEGKYIAKKQACSVYRKITGKSPDKCPHSVSNKQK
uniref:MICOS complex subunit n=1 Tax=Ciona savignyi TaxID=51511 RepID=H2YAK0_CIOSA